jgi:hypothetical protein
MMGENDAAPIQLCLTVFTVSFQKGHRVGTGEERASLLHVTADIHGMGPFGLILAPQPYNKLER